MKSADEILDAAGVPSAKPEPWEDFIPLGARAALPVFPVDVFPPYIAAMIRGVAKEIQVPLDLPGGLALAVLSTAAGRRAEVAVRGRWREQVNLYIAVAMPPGSGKSPAFRVMLAPVFAAEKELREAAKGKIKQAELDRRTAIATAEAKSRKAKTEEEINAAVDAARMAEEIDIPVMPRLTADDVNPEQAATLMADQGERLAILSAEGTFFEIIMGRYSGRPNLELVLKAHVGDRHPIDRRGREEFLEKPVLTIGLTVQPGMLRDIAAKKEMGERGALQRFLFNIPPDIVGHREIEPETIADDVVGDYTDTIKSLIVDLNEWTDPAVIQLSPAALKLHTEWRREIEPRLARGTGDLDSLREWASKLGGQTARLAGLLHLAEHPKNGPKMQIREATMERAITLAKYYVEHAMAAFGVMRAHPALDDARSVLAWIGDRTEFKPRDVQRALSRFTTAEDVAKPLALLEDHGYIRRAPEVTTGGRRPVVYEVHPGVAKR